MSKFTNIKKSVTDALMRTEVYQHGSSLVPKPNEKELIARLKPEQVGEERGKVNLPPVSATQPDEVETKIVDTLQEMADATTKDVNEALKTYNDRLSSLSMSGKLDEIRNTCQSGISDFLAELAEAQNYLLSFADDVVSCESDLKEFRKENRLRRSAIYSEGSKKILRYGVIIFLFAVEIIGNSVFLAKGNELGIAGASTEAIYISAINIGFAILVGIFVTRYMFHRSFFLKLLSSTFTICALGAAAVFNLLVAHYREVSGSGLFGDAGGQGAIEALKANPLGLESIEGWMLFLVGLLFWIVAVIDVHTLDDNYPGYGGVSRRAKNAREAYSNKFGEIVGELKEQRQDGQQEITDTRSELDAVLARIGTLKNSRHALLADYDIFKKQTEKVCVRIIEKYRNANLSVRSDLPESFQLNPILEYRSDFEALNSSFNADEELESVRSARGLLDKSITEFYSEFGQKIESLKPLSEVLER